MSLIVQKFGGTSLADMDCRERVVDKIIEAKKKYDDVVVIVSAMGRLGSPYATDTLLDLLKYEGRHIDDREMDMLIGCGEIISTVVVSNNIKARGGLKSEALTGGGAAGILTSSHFSSARVVDINTDRLFRILEEDSIPVIAGFQGRDDKGGDITTLGRGGSDTSAALIGEALEADVVEIYTDVDGGVMTADPRVYDEAKQIEHISYEEVFQMADNGAKVIHPGAVEVAKRSGMTMVIKNTFSDNLGTAITHYDHIEKPITINDNLITSIAHRDNRIQFSVEGDIDDETFFEDLADNGVSIDIINIFPSRRVFTTESDKKDRTIMLIEKYDAQFTYIDDCSKVTVIGERMTGVPGGVMARIVSSLSKENIQILQSADSLSTIACLIYSKDLEKAVHALHQAFGL